MIAKLKSNKSLGATIEYNLKEESQIIDTHNLQGESIDDYQRQMEKTQDLFEGRAKNLTGHIILSPSIEDGRKLSLDDWKEIASSYLQKTKLDKNESIVFLHDDKEHKHVHIVTNRINEQGKIYRNGSELHMSQRVGNELAAERGMKQARESMKERRQTNDKTVGLMSSVQRDLNKAVQEITLKHGRFEQQAYFEALKKAGYEVQIHTKKETGEVRGYGVQKNDHYYNASQLGKSYTLTSLLKESKEINKSHDQDIKQPKEQTPEFSLQSLRNNLQEKQRTEKDGTEKKQKITDELKAITKQSHQSQQAYFDALKKAGYEVEVHKHKDRDEIRGYSIKKYGNTYNASDIDRKFTLKELNKSGVIKEEQQHKKDKDQGLNY